MSEHSRQVFN